MTYYETTPVLVEAFRFEGGEENARSLLAWLNIYKYKAASWYSNRIESGVDMPEQFVLISPRKSIAEVGDYIVRLGDTFRIIKVDKFRETYHAVCPTCMGTSRETTNMVCQTCNHDYSKGS